MASYRLRKIVERKEVGIPPRYGHEVRELECGHRQDYYYSHPPTGPGYGRCKQVREQTRARCYFCH